MTEDRRETAVAITGMACRFPGAPDTGSFWRMLLAGAGGVQHFDREELRRAGVREELLANKAFVPACAPLPDPWAFDAAHFGVPPTTARTLDLQQRVFLECAWTALEASGVLAARKRAVAVFAGCSQRSAGAPWVGPEDGQGAEILASLGSASDYLGARVAFLLDLHGPAVTVRAACATSLVVVHLAVQSLLTHESDVAVAGSVAVRHPLIRGHLYEPGGIYSADGLCRPYDHLGTGIVSGDGGGVVVLRRLSDALDDGDHVHAVICGTAISNDGSRKDSFTAPSVQGQVEAALTAFDVAAVDPATVGFVEGHGTATPMGDPIEVEALRRVWRTGGQRARPCLLGSVKANIGHLDAAAGIAGLIKACLAVEHGQIPGTLNFTNPNPHLGLEGSPFEVSGTTRFWNEVGPRRASVHSIGLGGSNAHVVLEQAPPRPPAPRPPLVVLVLSTRRPDAMDEYGRAIADALGDGDVQFASAARTLQHGRSLEPFRQVVATADPERVVASLRALGQPARAAEVPPRLVLAFPGDGRRLRGGLGELARLLSPVAEAWRAGAEHLRTRWGLDLDQTLVTEGSPPGILPAIVVQGVALHAALAHFGVAGDVLIGQSLGELTAAAGAGLLSFEQALDLAMAREQAFRSVAESGALAVGMPVKALHEELPEDLELSLVNAPGRCVVSGLLPSLRAFAERLETRGVPVTELDVISAVHCSLLDPVLEAFRRAAAGIRPSEPQRMLLSAVGPVALDQAVAADPEHWVRQIRETVRFDACLEAAVGAGGDIIVVDTGPAGGLTAAIRETVGERVRDVVRLAPHCSSIGHAEAFAQALGRLWEHGVEVDWDALPGQCAMSAALPVAPLARTLHPPLEAGVNRPSLVVPEGRLGLWGRSWQKVPGGAWSAVRASRRVAVLAGADPVARNIAAALAQQGNRVQVVPPGEGHPGALDLLVDARALGESRGPRACCAFLALAQRLTGRRETPHLVVLTRGAFDVLGSETLSLAAAAVAATALVLSQEHGELDVLCLDLPCGDVDSELVAQILGRGEGPWLALRGRSAWRPRLESLGHDPESVRPLEETVCLITGGFGRYGRWVGRWLAQHGACHLVLVARSGMRTAQDQEAVHAMREAGAEVTVRQADVTDRIAMFGVLDEAARKGPVTLFHLAGLPHAPSAFIPVADLVGPALEQAMHEQWSAKVEGALTLLDWTRRNPGSRCLIFSSNASVLGGPGLGAYAAANAAVDALAVSARDREGLDWCSIGWDGWRLPDDDLNETPGALEAFALRGDEPRSGLWAAMGARIGHVAVAKGDLAERHRKWVERRLVPIGEGLEVSDHGTIAEDEVLDEVRRIWARVLGFTPADNADLFEQGGDSLSAMQIRSLIERHLGARLSLRDILQSRSISRTAASLRAARHAGGGEPGRESPNVAMVRGRI